MKRFFYLIIIGLFLAGCDTNQSIVNSIDERQANEIIVFLAAKGIAAQKVQVATSGGAVGASAAVKYDIYVDKKHIVDAMAILNQNGLPRMQGTNLLELFQKTTLMTSDKEETIRYQAGLEEELKNTILKIDGVIDADVRISFPSSTDSFGTQTIKEKTKAAVYVKHQGVFDDPNMHLESKIKRLVSGSIENLNFDDVSVISDKSRFTDVKYPSESKFLGPKALEKEYVKIWSIIMTKNSASKFRAIFFILIFVILLFASILGYFIYKFYPQIREKMKNSGIKRNE